MANEGRCVSCGFLAKYARTPDVLHVDLYLEVNLDQRQRGDLCAPISSGVRTAPVCLKHVIPLSSLVDHKAKTLSGDLQLAAREIISEDRQCVRWYPYAPGFTPKEHAEQLAMQQLETDRRQFEKELFALSQKVQEDSRAIADATKKITIWIGVIIIFLTLAQCAMVVLSYLSSRKPIYIAVPALQEPASIQPAEPKPN